MRSIQMFKKFITAFALVSCFSAFSQENTASSMTVNESDVVGKFAPVGYRGPYAETKTVDQAHEACLGQLGTGESAAVNTTDSFNAFYKQCMSDYVPFKTAGSNAINKCSSESVVWGQCRGSVQGLSDGQIATIQNSELGFEGYAKFACSNGNVQYVSGSCAAVANDCTEGAIAEWPVTSPLWAASGTSMIYVDKYGKQRSSPKPSCKAIMPKASSGLLVNAQPSASMMPDDMTYNAGLSVSAQRCFNSKWQYDQTAGSSNCTYVAKSCKAQTVTHNGCSFSVPELAHDAIYTNASPMPFMSSGRVEVYCFDGELEIKQASCQVSCSSSIPAATWSGSDPKQCRHDLYPTSTPVAPGVNILVPNIEQGMVGSLSYQCQNGVLVNTSSTCEPKSCDHIDAKTWGQCSHPAITGMTWKHGDVYSVDSTADIFSATGKVDYKCQYGGLSSGANGAMDLVGSPVCKGTGSTECSASPVTPPSTCVGGVQVGDVCCVIDSSGTPNCSKFNPPDATFTIEYGPWSAFTPVGSEKDCTEWTPPPETQPYGWVYTASSTCKQDEERTRNVTKVWSTGNLEAMPSEKESRVVDVVKTQDFIGAQGTSSAPFSVTVQKTNWTDSSPNAGTYSMTGDLVNVRINGYSASGVTEVTGSQGQTERRLIWNNAGCKGCYVRIDDITVNISEYSPPEYHAQYGTTIETIFSLASSSDFWGVGYKVYPSTTGNVPSKDTRDVVGDISFRVYHSDGRSVVVSMPSMASHGIMVCQVDTWHGC